MEEKRAAICSMKGRGRGRLAQDKTVPIILVLVVRETLREVGVRPEWYLS